ncbi:MAG TPA: YiiX/YebB-like N1pC/P60 family cysteine hydrolase [Myxococcota bacterium]|jgi:hypothetical protein|nr:YiiX/YebB-like N1pC/P60 family cysteine hydrolase [Myxococcota bacterium]
MPRRALPVCVALALIALVCGASAAASKLSKKASALPFVPQPGDVLLQALDGDLSRLIAGITGSPITHTGVVEERGGELYVLEAVGPVMRTPLRLWVKRGHGRYAVLRPQGALAAAIPAFLDAARARLGTPYDVLFEWDDAKLYCSELVYKAAESAAGVSLGARERLGDMNWRPYETEIRRIAGGELPLDRLIYTPVALTHSPYLATVYWGFER